ncbi:hypothetical protein KRR26_16735 [Corallococcus sp. M34]|uniref:hypothetical protein n=1 Tax=Citreicoccus inhibens TaxID=2849499 RepID=UPI001C243DB6|nr:hypothetical protein [Citreicoccus inhibens]MBU8897263.1 hypothetical protein [Citreicoccus inhibens]
MVTDSDALGPRATAFFGRADDEGFDFIGGIPTGLCHAQGHSLALAPRGAFNTKVGVSIGSQVRLESALGVRYALAKTLGSGGAMPVSYGFSDTHSLGAGAYTVSWDGDFSEPAFSGPLLELPEAPVPGSATLALSSGKPTEVSWSGPTGDMVLLEFRVASGNNVITCAVRDTGSFIITPGMNAALNYQDQLILSRVKVRQQPYATGQDSLKNTYRYDVVGVGIRSAAPLPITWK